MSKNNVLDPMTGELIDAGNPLDVEDTSADAEGAETRAQAKSDAHAPQMLPQYLEGDFEFKRGNKDTSVAELLASGKRAYFLSPRTSAVNLSIADAESALAGAIAVKLKDGDIDAAAGLAEQVRDVDYALSGLDQWLGNLVKRAIARQVASDAVFIARGARMLESWNPTADDGVQRKESFEEVLFTAQKRLAILHHALHVLDATKDVNIKAATWQRMQSEARKNQGKYLHAEEYNVQRSLRKDHATEAGRASASLLLRRAPTPVSKVA